MFFVALGVLAFLSALVAWFFISQAESQEKQKLQSLKEMTEVAPSQEEQTLRGEVASYAVLFEDFAVVARAVSEHKESAQNGGDLGLLSLPTDIYSIWKPEDSPFPVDVGFFQALGELGAGEAKLYEGFIGYFIVKITGVQEGLVGTQSFDEWYQEFRARANVVMF